MGIVKVAGAERLTDALEDAFAHDGLAIVEAMAFGKEVECGVLGTLASERDGGQAALASADRDHSVRGCLCRGRDRASGDGRPRARQRLATPYRRGLAGQQRDRDGDPRQRLDG